MSKVIQKAKSLTALKGSVEKAKSLIARKEKTETPKTPKQLPVQKRIVKGNPDNQYKSKLMMCIEVLCTLVPNGPMKLTQLRDKFEMDEARLKPHLRLLWNRGLIEEEDFGEEEPYYVVTERGLKVLKVVSPLIKEAHKLEMRNFEAISNVLSGAGYA
jgi:DNA-binding HxlR family transcriptional regulator